jgi:DNA-binding CsgD family transcriptional regulator
VARELADRRSEALVLNNLGRVAYYEGDLARARALSGAALVIRRQVGDRRGIATSLADLGDVAHQQGDLIDARALRSESLALWQQLEDPWGLAYALEGFAEMALAFDEYAAVPQLVVACTLMRESIRAPRSPAAAARMEQLVAAARRHLTRAEEAQALAAGQALLPEDAVALALRLSARAEPPPGDVGRLSPRERQVAALITRGLTNRQIAEALVIGERTVHTHVTNILSKLELTSRTQIAAWGVGRGIR